VPPALLKAGAAIVFKREPERARTLDPGAWARINILRIVLQPTA
jgi:hypothetical protein